MKFCTKCNTQLHDDDRFCTKCGSKTFESSTEATNSTNNSKKADKQKKNIMINKAYICPIVFGIVLILIGYLIPIQGGVLTTYESLNGVKTENYVFDDKYTAIDEYVGGDAYNYIIGASLVAGKISGIITTKSIFVVGGTLCLCLGITLKLLTKRQIIKTVIGDCTPYENYEENSTHNCSHTS